jgi:simple sugar transport system ATP-binding protein
VFISSELEEVLRISQRVVVMRDRHKIGELASNDIEVGDLIDFIAQEHENRPESVA